MTTLLLTARQDSEGRVFLVDREGNDLPGQWVEADRSYDTRAASIIAHNKCVGDLDDKLEAAHKAMLSAARVDVSAAVVELPPTCNKWNAGWNDYHDAMKKVKK